MKKLINKYDIILAALFAFAVSFSTRVHFNGDVWSLADQNYIEDGSFVSVLIWVLSFVAIWFILYHGERLAEKLILPIAGQDKISVEQRKILITWAVVLVLAWLPYYLSYYPGGVYSDTFASIKYAYNGVYSDRHTVLYNLLIKWAVDIGVALGKDLEWSMAFFTLCQMLAAAGVFLYFEHWMLAKALNRYVRIACSLFYIFYPLIPLYLISVWKDTPFAIVFWLWMMALVDFWLMVQEEKFDRRRFGWYLMGLTLVAFARNNGVYIVAFVSLFVALAIHKSSKKLKKGRIIGVNLAVVLLILLIQGPIYGALGVVKPPAVEKFGIPLQQMAAVVYYEGNISEEQLQSLNQFIPIGQIREHYSPCLVDNLKWKGGLQNQYLARNSGEFLKLWRELLVQNPAIYVRAYLLETLGFWNVDVASPAAYIQNYMWENQYELSGHDYFEDWFGFSFQHYVNPRRYISSAWLVVIFLLAQFYLMKKHGWRWGVVFAPQIGIWITLMVATPIAVSLRYVVGLLFTLPFAVIVPILAKRVG